MRVRLPLVAAFVAVSVAFGQPHAASAANGHWQPDGLQPARGTLADALAAYARGTGTAEPAYARRHERYVVTIPGGTLDADATVADGDFRVETQIDGAVYASGRSGGRRWRRTPAGTVRVVESDVQGDDLDRWPVAVLGFDPARCTLAGETRGDEPAYVLAYAPDGEIPHWLFVDERTGLLVRETTRDGSRVVTYAFDDVRTAFGIRRPYRWTVSGAGGTADVRVTAVDETDVAPDETALPHGAGELFVSRDGDVAHLRASFVGDQIFVDGTIAGRTAVFGLDSGSTQLLLDAGFAHRAGLATTLGHAIAPRASVADADASGVPFLVVGLGDPYRCDAILGNDFFRGHVVHIDYRRGRVDLIPHARFVAPADARDVDVSYAEGLPLVAGRIGDVTGARFALDTGSRRVLVPRYFAEHDADGKSLATTYPGRPFVARFLEGPIDVRPATVAGIDVGPFRLGESRVDLETAGDGTTIDIPLDAIVGTDVLAQLELWFDYDAGKLYARPA